MTFYLLCANYFIFTYLRSFSVSALQPSLMSFMYCVAVYDGLAIDVGRQKLYYTDAADTGGKVGELSTDGSGHRVLINDVYSSPRGVVIDVDNR